MLTALEELVLDLLCEKRYVYAHHVAQDARIGAEERAEAFEKHRALMALASALQGEEVEKR